MLSYFCRNDGVTLCKSVKLLYEIWTCKLIFVISKWILCLHLCNMLHPFIMGLLSKLLAKLLKYILYITFYAKVNLNVLIYLSRIDVYMKYLGSLCKALGIACNSV